MQQVQLKDYFIFVDSNSINSVDKQILLKKNINNNYCVIIDLNYYNSLEPLIKILNKVISTKMDLSRFTFCIQAKGKHFDKNEQSVLKNFETTLKMNGKEMYFKIQNTLLSFDELYNETLFFDEMQSTVKSANLSELEQFLFCYKALCENFEKTNTTIENLNLFVPYDAKMLKLVLDKLNNKNIKTYICNCKQYETDNKYASNCQFNVVYLKDAKYNIKGLYVVDLAKDAKTSKKETFSLSSCLIPFDDLHLCFNKSYYPMPDNPFEYLLLDEKPQKIYAHVNEKVRKFLTNLNFFDMQQTREDFKNKLLEKYKEKNEDKYYDLCKKFKSCPFEGRYLEYVFLKYCCNKIKKESTPIKYEDFLNALWHIYALEKLNPIQIKEKIKNITKTSKEQSYLNYLRGSQNAFAKLAYAEHDNNIDFQKQIKSMKQKNKLNKGKEKE